MPSSRTRRAGAASTTSSVFFFVLGFLGSLGSRDFFVVDLVAKETSKKLTY
jgi:hypothetical protein